jgi:hypothetical protein
MWHVVCTEEERRAAMFGQEEVVYVEAPGVFERADIEGDGSTSAELC